MKTNHYSSGKHQDGSALLISMLVAGLTIAFIPLYLVWAQAQHQSVGRSQDWNSALTVVEAGVEDAFGHLNKDCYTNEINGGNLQWSGVDGWTRNSNVFTPGVRYIGADGNYYDVRVLGNPEQVGGERYPTIVAVGYTRSYSSRGTTTTAAINNPPAPGSQWIARQVRVDTKLKVRYDAGIKMDGNINGQVLLDAFDSQVWSNSFYGIYDPRYHLDQATMLSISGDIDLSTHGTVYGTVQTSGDGTLSGGTVGDAGWVSTNTGVQDGHWEKDAKVDDMDPVELPDVTWSSLFACNCRVTYTNPAVVAATIESETYPSPPPPGGVITNWFGSVEDSTVYPANAAALLAMSPPLLVTNTYCTNATTFPTNTPATMTSAGVQTNGGLVWKTNTAPNQTSPPTYPTGKTQISEVLTVVSNYLASPPPTNCCHDGVYSVVTKTVNNTNSADRTKINGNWYTNYTYSWIGAYKYQDVAGYTWCWYTYNYSTPTYVYVGTNIDAQVITSTFKYVVPTGNWKVNGDLSLSGLDKMLITGNARIYVTGAFNMTGSSKIIILNGASLKFYFGGDVKLAGNGIQNQNSDATKLEMLGLPTCENIAISGNGSFVGSLYAPNADITLNGNGNNYIKIIGAIAGESLKSNGQPQVIQDLNLFRNGPLNGFVATSWVEEKVGTQP